MATVKQVLEQVDAMLPNQYTTAEKRRWLLQAEGFVVRGGASAPRRRGGGTGAAGGHREDTVLLVQPPYDELYRHYVEKHRSTTPTGRWSGTTMPVPLGTTPC